MRTLVLNQSYVPIDIQDWKKAIKKVFSEKAEILEGYTDAQLQDWSSLNAPSVIRLFHFLNPPKKTRYEPFTRKNVWVRDKGKCQYCGKFVSLAKMTFDHITPKSQGGRTTWKNIVTCCLKCNSKKDNKTPKEARMRLRSRPIAPIAPVSLEKTMVLRLKNLRKLPDSAWRNYIYFELPLLED